MQLHVKQEHKGADVEVFGSLEGSREVRFWDALVVTDSDLLFRDCIDLILGGQLDLGGKYVECEMQQGVTKHDDERTDDRLNTHLSVTI